MPHLSIAQKSTYRGVGRRLVNDKSRRPISLTEKYGLQHKRDMESKNSKKANDPRVSLEEDYIIIFLFRKTILLKLPLMQGI